jgi:hypothetical protein
MSDLTPGNRLDRPVDDEFDHVLERFLKPAATAV